MDGIPAPVPDCVNPNIDIFVKRIPAVRDPKTAPNFWLLPVAAGSSSATLQKSMVETYTRLGGSVNVNNMDQRWNRSQYIAGLRRSTRG
ncbi:unnamed protein product [Peronospora belbahrii]|uniref:Uncharacterized protein n=1 Tax=Peronospora belbahrii TaxID=622444 RepID=A0ABN8D569_9STRA|nr:unnamed protein product [Peronospora belbahrii]